MVSQQSPAQSIGNLLFTIVLPTIILIKFSSALGIWMAFLLALSLPLCYGLGSLVVAKKVSGFAILGIINVCLTGGVGLLRLDPEWLAFKEAFFPFVIGIVTILYTYFKGSFFLPFLKQLLDYDRIEKALAEQDNTSLFDSMVLRFSYWVSMSFFLSAILNYMLAKHIVVSDPGTINFNQELGRMTALSFPVIALPMTILLAVLLWRLFTQLHRLTGIPFEEFFPSVPKGKS